MNLKRLMTFKNIILDHSENESKLTDSQYAR
jgi:hypothetical protein